MRAAYYGPLVHTALTLADGFVWWGGQKVTDTQGETPWSEGLDWWSGGGGLQDQLIDHGVAPWNARQKGE
jgi:hypothetical protein